MLMQQSRFMQTIRKMVMQRFSQRLVLWKVSQIFPARKIALCEMY